MTAIAFALFALTIPAANWMIGHVGACAPGGPCLIPVGFGLMAPSGVLMVGLALVLRDWLHELGGRGMAFAAILVGAGLSFGLATPALAVASGAAFLLSETADLAVYAPLRQRHRPLAVMASGVVGAAVDSALFLWLAFGSLDFLAGQVVGKLWMSAGAAVLLWALSRRRLA